MPEGEEANLHIRVNEPHLLGLTWINSVLIMGFSEERYT